ncbi:MAG: RNA polymerase sigma-70 factor (ECF subfamily) [Mariniblastus sp.]|jgi:RNA polymerase sigma-70 factor (ECF subfamily)
MDSTSESLLLRLKSSDDHQAWSRFVRLYTPLLFYWARKMGLQSQDASDLVQDVFTLVFQKLPEFQYDKTKSFRAWLRTVTINKLREWCRKKSLGAIDVTQSAWANIGQQASRAQSTWDMNYQQALVARAMNY